MDGDPTGSEFSQVYCVAGGKLMITTSCGFSKWRRVYFLAGLRGHTGERVGDRWWGESLSPRRSLQRESPWTPALNENDTRSIGVRFAEGRYLW